MRAGVNEPASKPVPEDQLAGEAVERADTTCRFLTPVLETLHSVFRLRWTLELATRRHRGYYEARPRCELQAPAEDFAAALSILATSYKIHR